ncbi:MAG: alkaline phosphatase family protein [Acidobacteria bacterium]|nr:alkaline phosphatase family protein [Acidobacteriota bacterium]
MRLLRWSGLLAVLVAVVFHARVPIGAQPPATTRPADHVIVISIDGFRPAIYLDPEGESIRVPNLIALRDAGSAADGVQVSAPSLTYPSHTSLATGVSPSRHGIISNTMFGPPAGSTRWYYEASAIKVPAIWDVAKQHGVKTAGASWPVTVGAGIDVLFPESNQAPPDSTWLARARQDSTPGLVDAVVKTLGGFGENDNRDAIQRDRFTAAMAAHIIRSEKPGLLMIHLMETDTTQHADGPGSPSSRQAIQRIDAHIGAIVRATEEAGIRPRTTFIVSGDHGFSRVHALVQPNVILREGGWLTTDPRGRIVSWQAAAHATAIRLRDPNDRALAATIESAFRAAAEGRYRGIFRVVSRAELDTLGAYPEAAFSIEPAEGYYVSDGVVDNAVLVGTTRRGAHGFLPTETRMRTGFIAAGAGIRAGVPLPLVRQIDIAPTVAQLLGFDMPDADGLPLVGLLAR